MCIAERLPPWFEALPEPLCPGMLPRFDLPALLVALTRAIPMPLQPQSSGLKVGLFGIGLDVYWLQFAGLEKRLQGYIERVAGKLGAFGCEVVNLGLIDTPEKAAVAGHDFRRPDVDLIFTLCDDVCAVFDRAAGAEAGEGSGGGAEPCADGGDRLPALATDGGPDADDRGVAGVLFGLSGAGDCQRLSALPHSVLSGYGDTRG